MLATPAAPWRPTSNDAPERRARGRPPRAAGRGCSATAGWGAITRLAHATRRCDGSTRSARLVARLHAASATRAIRVVFGRHAAEALAVARCESGLSEWAQNGQYLGLFQMGTAARSRYGHGASPYDQAKAAHAYFVDSGRGWWPWPCKPA